MYAYPLCFFKHSNSVDSNYPVDFKVFFPLSCISLAQLTSNFGIPCSKLIVVACDVSKDAYWNTELKNDSFFKYLENYSSNVKFFLKIYLIIELAVQIWYVTRLYVFEKKKSNKKYTSRKKNSFLILLPRAYDCP